MRTIPRSERSWSHLDKASPLIPLMWALIGGVWISGAILVTAPNPFSLALWLVTIVAMGLVMWRIVHHLRRTP